MSELARYIDYDPDGEPALVIHKKQHKPQSYVIDKKPKDAYRIGIDDVWQFSEDHYPAVVPCLLGFDRGGLPVVEHRMMRFDDWMFWKTMELCAVLELGEATTQRMVDLADTIQGGIEDLLKTPPQPTADKCVGEVKMTVTAAQGGGEQVFVNDMIISEPVESLT